MALKEVFAFKSRIKIVCLYTNENGLMEGEELVIGEIKVEVLEQCT